MKPSVYIETTVVSYLTANISRDLLIAAHQQSTLDWWQTMRPKVECYISPFVINEITQGDEQLAQMGIYTPVICTPEELMEV